MDKGQSHQIKGPGLIFYQVLKGCSLIREYSAILALSISAKSCPVVQFFRRAGGLARCGCGLRSKLGQVVCHH